MASAAHIISSDLSEPYLVRTLARIGSLDAELPVMLHHLPLGASAVVVASICADPAGISLASMLASSIAAEPGSHRSEAVYVVASDAGATKIGWTNNPALRLQNLQIGSPSPLHLAALFWLIDSEAVQLERLSHKVARAAGASLRGEWTSFTAAEASLAIAEVVSGKRIRVASSMQWVRNRQAMQLARRSARKCAYDNSISTVGPTRRDCRSWTT